jgi:outer membrane protein
MVGYGFAPRGVMKAVLLCLGIAVSTANLAAQSKVAVVDFNKALLETQELKKAQAALQTKFKPRADALEKLQNELQEIQTLLQNPEKLTQNRAGELQMQGQNKQRQAQRMQEDLQADVERERNDILGKSSERMAGVLKKLAEEKGVDVIVNISNTLYFKPALDISAEATAAYDKAFPAR